MQRKPTRTERQLQNMQKQKKQERLREKIEREQRAKKFRFIKSLFKFLLLIALLIGAIAFALTTSYFNIAKIEIIGNEQFDEESYINLSTLKIDENIFKFLKMDVVNSIKENAYVDTVKVKRKLPSTVQIIIEERKASYIIKKDEDVYALVNNQGYILNLVQEKENLVELSGISTELEELKLGKRLKDEDLEKLQDLIQIKDSMNNAAIDEQLTKMDIESKYNYILYFEKEAKEVKIGGTNDLSTKMLYLKYILDAQYGVPGTIYLDQDQKYFSPN